MIGWKIVIVYGLVNIVYNFIFEGGGGLLLFFFFDSVFVLVFCVCIFRFLFFRVFSFFCNFWFTRILFNFCVFLNFVSFFLCCFLSWLMLLNRFFWEGGGVSLDKVIGLVVVVLFVLVFVLLGGCFFFGGVFLFLEGGVFVGIFFLFFGFGVWLLFFFLVIFLGLVIFVFFVEELLFAVRLFFFIFNCKKKYIYM